MYFIKLNKQILLIIAIFIVAASSCRKEYRLDHQAIDTSYADSFIGSYYGTLHTNNGYSISPEFEEKDTVALLVVSDIRTLTECKLFIDYINDSIYVLKNGSFTTEWNFNSPSDVVSVFLSAKFKGDSLIMKEYQSSKWTSFVSFEFRGKKV